MERLLVIISVIVLIAILGVMAFLFVRDPMDEHRVTLDDQLAAVKPVDVAFQKPNWDFDKWQNSLATKPALWKELVEAPPPAPPAPPPPPDLQALLKDVTAGRQQVGNKVKILKKGDARGSFLGVGETLNGLTIKEITKKEVVFSMTWQGKELTVNLPRE